MKILVTNDDGILSPVLSVLAEALAKRHEVRVVAPMHDQSGMAQAFTYSRGLLYKQVDSTAYPAYQVEGTPCDCIKFAVSHLFKDEKIDLVVSGINLGENAGMSTLYSGTVAAAREGAMWGIPAMALSVWTNSTPHLHFAVNWLADLLERPGMMDNLAKGLWNVNFPACAPEEIEGVEFTDMSTVMFVDHYVAVTLPNGITEYQLRGHKPAERFVAGTDDYALSRNKIAITPLGLAQSAGDEVRRLNSLRPEFERLARAGRI